MTTRSRQLARERARIRNQVRTHNFTVATPAAVAAPRIDSVITDSTLHATRRVSAIDPTYPVFGTPATVTVRNNFRAAKDEIEELQGLKLDRSGGVMTGEIVLTPNQRIDGGIF